MQIHTPIITSNDCEGAGELFEVEVSYGVAAPALVLHPNDENRRNNNLHFYDSHRTPKMRKTNTFSPSQPTSPCRGSYIWK